MNYTDLELKVANALPVLAYPFDNDDNQKKFEYRINLARAAIDVISDSILVEEPHSPALRLVPKEPRSPGP